MHRRTATKPPVVLTGGATVARSAERGQAAKPHKVTLRRVIPGKAFKVLIMKFTDLKQDLKSEQRQIYLFEGADAYFRSSGERMVKAKFLQNEQLNFASFDGSALKGAALSDLTSALAVFPFMSEYRIIKVSEFYPTEQEYEKYLKPTFENFPASSILIIVNSQSGKGCDLKRKKCISYFDCSKVDREMVARWCYLTMKKQGVSSSVEACEAIADYCLCDMSRVSKEVEKLIEWGKQGLITKTDVDELVYKDADYRIYQMTAAVAAKNYSQFAEICSDLLSKGYDINAVIASLLNYFKNLLTVLSGDNRGGAISKQLKMTDYVYGKNLQQAKSIGRERLISLISRLYNTASSLKSGRITQDGALDSVFAEVFFY